MGFLLSSLLNLCNLYATIYATFMSSVSQWNETDSACELLALQVSVLFIPRTLREGE